MDEHSEVEHPWQRLERSMIRLSESLLVYKDKVRVKPEVEIDYFFLERPVSATVVARTSTNELVMIRQYRYPIDIWCWELPAGAMIPGEDEDIVATARRELEEETGAVCKHLKDVGWFYVASHLANEITHVVVGTDAVMGESLPEPSEVIQVHLVPVQEALNMARRGAILDGPSALAILLAERWL